MAGLDYLKALDDNRITFDCGKFHVPETGKSHSALEPSTVHVGEYVAKHALKTGTTICGCVTKTCVVLAADTRATMGPVVADKECFKLHKLANNIWAAGAGVSADLEHVTLTLQAEMKVFSQQLGQLPRVESCVTRLQHKLFQYQGHIVTALILGGVNPTGEMSLWYCSPNGYASSSPFLAMGSGGYFAEGVLEQKYKADMTREEAMELCADAIEAGVMNDLGSGTQVDLVVINLDDPTHPVVHRGFRTPVKQQKIPSTRPSVPLGVTKVIKEVVTEVEPFRADYLSQYL